MSSGDISGLLSDSNAARDACIFPGKNYPSGMLRINKSPPLKLRRSNAFTRFLARPVVRFGIAGCIGVFISFMLLVFMMYISQNYNSKSSMASQILYDLELVKLKDQDQQRRVKLPKPPTLKEVTEPPGREQIRKELMEREQAAGSGQQTLNDER